MTKDYPVKISESANLLTQPAISLENVGEGNFIRMRNWRRAKDQLIRREGWVLFEPDDGTGPSQAVFDGTETVMRLAELRRPNGEKVIIGASRTKIKKFDTATWSWTVIGSGYSAQGKRWQPFTSNGYLVLNNTVDLPVSYRVEDATVTPLYELREVGIASVERIAEYNGFLVVLGLVEIQSDQLDKFMNGYTSYAPGSTVAKVANFAILSTDTGKQFNVTNGGGNVLATLPSPVANPNFWVWIKKMDAGNTVQTTPVTVGDAVVLDGINDIALVWSDGSRYLSKVFPDGVVPVTTPYGIPPSDILNHYPYGVAWSEFGQPTHWAPLFDVYVTASSATLTLPFASSAFIANETRVAVINGGPDNGTLGGDSDHPNGILVTGVAGRNITLELPTDPALTYPRTVQVTRWGDVSTLVGRALLQGDGSPIIAALKLQGMLMIYRTTGIYTMRYTGDVAAPFTFKEFCASENMPKFGDCLASINGDFHLYPGAFNRFYRFDGSTPPEIYEPADSARDLFFTDLDEDAECFSVENAITKEIWFCRPGLTFAFDYEYGKPSEMDAQIDAACSAIRPGGVDKWYVIGLGTSIFTYGLVIGIDPIRTWLRNGTNPGATLISGYVHGGDTIGEKDIHMLLPILASPSPDAPIVLRLRGSYNPSVVGLELLDPPEYLPNPAGENYVALLFRAIFFQYQIDLSDDILDIDARLSEIQYQFDYVRAGPVPRRNI